MVLVMAWGGGKGGLGGAGLAIISQEKGEGQEGAGPSFSMKCQKCYVVITCRCKKN